MKRPTLAFVDHSFHKKTHSSDFLRDLFRGTFDVYEYWDESWNGGLSVSAEELNKHDQIFFLQVLCPLRELRKIQVPMMWSPMYDGFKFNFFYVKTLSYLNIKILSFSEKMSLWLSQFSIPVMTLHYYYLPPTTPYVTVPDNHLFFWYRGDITFNDLRPLLDPNQIDSFTILEVPDTEGLKLALEPGEMETYKITYLVEKFLSREKYLELVSRSSIFIAPRKKEGIGAFTEALMLGKCVIAYDDAVHNEYITHGVDGLLFDSNSSSIDLSNTALISAAARNRATSEYGTWLLNKENVIPFMTKEYHVKKSVFLLHLWDFLNTISRRTHLFSYYLKEVKRRFAISRRAI